MASSLLRYEDIAPRAWEHPADRAALEALRSVPGFDRVVASTLGRLNEWTMRKRMLGDAVEVTPDAHPRIWQTYQDVLWALDAPETWPLYTRPMGGMNAAAVGMDEPFIVIASEGEARLSRDDLKVVLAHEVAHILSGHILYKSMLRAAIALGWAAVAVPASLAVAGGVYLALTEWDRKSELSADRASALVMGGAEPVVATLRKVAAAHDSAWIHETPLPPGIDAAVRRALQGVGRAVSRHPPASRRITALRDWVAGEEWAALRRGEYPRRSDRRIVELAVPERPMESLRAGFAEAVKPISRLFSGEP
ncbi:MAG: M48 family metallopeptidase [Myxococcota bacterium]|nr:M48 family metallopeptidase [Myxococcota bacterium]